MSAPRRWFGRILTRHLLWTLARVFVAVVLGLGTWGFLSVGADVPGAVYKSIQLFGLNFDLPEEARKLPLPLQLKIARMLAALVLIATVIKLLADGLGLRLHRLFNTRGVNFPRDLVLGFEGLGTEIGRRLIATGRRITWIDRVESNDASA